ncbi:MAG: OmpH family outer membrane protein [Trueperaceae bacterium]|jgi:outer membrane protein
MRRLTLLGIAVAALLALFASTLTAQERTSHVVYLNSQAAINAHPAGSQIETLSAQARSEIEGLVNSITALEQKAASGQQLTPDEADRYAALQSSIVAVDSRYRAEIEAAAAPAMAAVDEVLRSLATELNYTMVIDSIAAAETGIVVYADPSLDITQLVIDRITGQ